MESTDPSTDPFLTIVVVNDGQKDPKLLKYYFRALSFQDLSRVQVILLQQAVDGNYAREIAAKQNFPVQVHECTCKAIGDTRLWDVMHCLGEMRPQIKGQYLLYMHKEYICGRDVLAKSIEWLEQEHTDAAPTPYAETPTYSQPNLALANLRRVGKAGTHNYRIVSSDPHNSAIIKGALTAGPASRAWSVMDNIPSTPWVHNRTRRRPPGKWVEDAFFVKMAWLDEINFFNMCDRMLFQDVFDLLGEVFTLNKDMYVPRVPIELGTIYHLAHPKAYLHFNDAVLDYFQETAPLWKNTYFADAGFFATIRKYLKDPAASSDNPIVKFRRGIQGTITRWKDAYIEFLAVPEPKPEPERGYLMPRSQRDGYVFQLYNRDWRRWKRVLKPLTKRLRGLGDMVRVVSLDRATQPLKPLEDCNCVIDMENLIVLAEEFGIQCPD